MITMQRLAVVAIAMLALAACSTDESDQAVGDMTVPEATEQPASGMEAPALRDPQIAHIAVTAITIAVETAELDETRAQSPEVQAFARTMITDHTAVNEQAGALAQRLGVTPQANEVSSSLQSDAEAARSRLEGLSGTEFDRAYIDREVEYHQAVLDALDNTLIPNASNAELRGLLEDVRPAIQAHLDHARSLQSQLAGN